MFYIRYLVNNLASVLLDFSYFSKTAHLLLSVVFHVNWANTALITSIASQSMNYRCIQCIRIIRFARQLSSYSWSVQVTLKPTRGRHALCEIFRVNREQTKSIREKLSKSHELGTFCRTKITKFNVKNFKIIICGIICKSFSYNT